MFNPLVYSVYSPSPTLDSQAKDTAGKICDRVFAEEWGQGFKPAMILLPQHNTSKVREKLKEETEKRFSAWENDTKAFLFNLDLDEKELKEWHYNMLIAAYSNINSVDGQAKNYEKPILIINMDRLNSETAKKFIKLEHSAHGKTNQLMTYIRGVQEGRMGSDKFTGRVLFTTNNLDIYKSLSEENSELARIEGYQLDARKY